MRSSSFRVMSVLFLAAALCSNAPARTAGKKGVDLGGRDKTCKAGDTTVRPAGESCRIW